VESNPTYWGKTEKRGTGGKRVNLRIANRKRREKEIWLMTEKGGFVSSRRGDANHLESRNLRERRKKKQLTWCKVSTGSISFNGKGGTHSSFATGKINANSEGAATGYIVNP